MKNLQEMLFFLFFLFSVRSKKLPILDLHNFFYKLNMAI